MFDSCHLCAVLVITDVAILANKVFLSLQAVNDAEDQLTVIDRLEHSYVSAAMRQLVCRVSIVLFTSASVN